MPELSSPEPLVATPAAINLIRKLQAANGPVVLYHPTGCFGNAELSCFPHREFLRSSSEVEVGRLDGACVYIPLDDLDMLDMHQLVVDARPGKGGLFAMERRLGIRFFVRLRPLEAAMPMCAP